LFAEVDFDKTMDFPVFYIDILFCLSFWTGDNNCGKIPGNGIG